MRYVRGERGNSVSDNTSFANLVYRYDDTRRNERIAEIRLDEDSMQIIKYRSTRLKPYKLEALEYLCVSTERDWNENSKEMKEDDRFFS